MSEQPKPNAYVVSMVFASGPHLVTLTMAPNPEHASLYALHTVIRERPEVATWGDVASLAVMPIAPEWLRMAIKMCVEGGDPSATVLSLVPPPQTRKDGEHLWDNDNRLCVLCGTHRLSVSAEGVCPGVHDRSQLFGAGPGEPPGAA